MLWIWIILNHHEGVLYIQENSNPLFLSSNKLCPFILSLLHHWCRHARQFFKLFTALMAHFITLAFSSRSLGRREKGRCVLMFLMIMHASKAKVLRGANLLYLSICILTYLTICTSFYTYLCIWFIHSFTFLSQACLWQYLSNKKYIFYTKIKISKM